MSLKPDLAALRRSERLRNDFVELPRNFPEGFSRAKRAHADFVPAHQAANVWLD